MLKAEIFYRRKQDGITLIAIVVTIVVLLIVAGISISMLGGENGIIMQARKAKDKTIVGEEKELISIVYTSEKSKNVNEQVGAIDMQNEINKQKKAIVTQTADKLVIKFKDTGNRYEVDNTGKVNESIRENEEILSKYETDEYIDETIGIDMYGNRVNMELWDFSVEEGTALDFQYTIVYNRNNTLSSLLLNPNLSEDPEQMIYGGKEIINLANITIKLSNSTIEYRPGYIGEIVEGKIQGEVPAYIKPKEKNYFIKVTKMSYTFGRDTISEQLLETPTLPDGIEVMDGTFAKCTNLVKVNNLPRDLKNMRTAFTYCTLLEELPQLPEGVMWMNGTFARCNSLKKIPNIPSTVKTMQKTFGNCSNLSGTITINSNLVQYEECFVDAATNEGCQIIVNAPASIIDGIVETKNTGNVVKGTEL